jgi:hypothetical protein
VTYLSECHEKVRYLTRKAARLAKKQMPGSGHLNAYTCGHCGLWHLGHLNPYVRAHARRRRQAASND